MKPLQPLKATDLDFLFDKEPKRFNRPLKIVDIRRNEAKPQSCMKVIGRREPLEKLEVFSVGSGSGTKY